MILYNQPVYLIDGRTIVKAEDDPRPLERFSESERAAAREGTIAWPILKKHNQSGSMDRLALKFDALVGQDLTYMGVLQTAIASGIKEFPIPFVLSNCHNSLCALGGTINEDDHVFAADAAKKYGGIMLPTHQAVMHQYMREVFAGGGKMILGADSHTRYGALGTLATGEGGGELAKQLLGKTYDINYPDTVLVYLTGKPVPGVGPHDVMLDIIGHVFDRGFVKNSIMEFVGPGIKNLSVDFRNGVDVMSTEASCMFTIWETDEKVREWLALHGREEDYKKLSPAPLAQYDRLIEIDLSEIRPMIALPFHPKNTYTIEELNQNPYDILKHTEEVCNEQMSEFGLKIDLLSKIVDGRIRSDQGVIAGCAGGLFENIAEAADILRGRHIGNATHHLNIYPASQPVLYEVMDKGIGQIILQAGANLRTAFCGPCFGAGDTPFQGGFSVRHTTRNFSNREGSRPKDGQLASVALMDARSVAATAVNGGFLTPATDYTGEYTKYHYVYHPEIYEQRVINYFGKADPSVKIRKGPNIGDIPEVPKMRDDLLVKLTAVIHDPVTTTDELIPNGESSSYRSNFKRIADFTLSARVPEYVGRCKKILDEQERLLAGEKLFETDPELAQVKEVLSQAGQKVQPEKLLYASGLYARKPGDGSAREYAASNQKVLGGWLNIAEEYATKRYRSNLINWGVLPFLYNGDFVFEVGDFVWVPNVKQQLKDGQSEMDVYIIRDKEVTQLTLDLGELSERERAIMLQGNLINFYQEDV